MTDRERRGADMAVVLVLAGHLCNSFAILGPALRWRLWGAPWVDLHPRFQRRAPIQLVEN